MPATNVMVNYSFRDSKGQIAHVRLDLNQGGAASVQALSATVAAAIAGLTNCAVRDPLANVGFLNYGTTAQFADVEDKAVYNFVDTTSGELAKASIPAPIAATFLADLETIDPANAAVVTWVALWTGGNIKDRAGLNTWAFLGGQRIRRRTQRKFNIYTKSPGLAGPGE